MKQFPLRDTISQKFNDSQTRPVHILLTTFFISWHLSIHCSEGYMVIYLCVTASYLTAQVAWHLLNSRLVCQLEAVNRVTSILDQILEFERLQKMREMPLSLYEKERKGKSVRSNLRIWSGIVALFYIFRNNSEFYTKCLKRARAKPPSGLSVRLK